MKDKERLHRHNEQWKQDRRRMGKRRADVAETWQDRGVGGRMAVRIYGRFITLPALPRLL